MKIRRSVEYIICRFQKWINEELPMFSDSPIKKWHRETNRYNVGGPQYTRIALKWWEDVVFEEKRCPNCISDEVKKEPCYKCMNCGYEFGATDY